jgi:hypothetical protein
MWVFLCLKKSPPAGAKNTLYFYQKTFDTHEKNGYIVSVGNEAITISLLKKVL